MSSRYTWWAIALAVFLEIGIFILRSLNFISVATTASCGFAVGAVLIAALMLRPVVAEEDTKARGPDRWDE